VSSALRHVGVIGRGFAGTSALWQLVDPARHRDSADVPSPPTTLGRGRRCRASALEWADYAPERRVVAGQRPSPGVGCHRSSRYPVNPGMSANSLPLSHCEPARVHPWHVRRSGFHTFRCVFLFAPSAPAVQVFIPTMRAFDRSQLIIKIRQRFAARCCSRNRDDSPARSVLTQPSYVDLARHHLLRRPDINVAQRR
jgi:hypothetical protein